MNYFTQSFFHVFQVFNSYKIVKHTQTIRWQQSKNCLSVVGHFVGLALKRLKSLVYPEEHLKIQLWTNY